MKLTDKQALQEWEQYLQSIREETAIDRATPVAEREKRRQWLEAHPAQNGSKSFSHSPSLMYPARFAGGRSRPR